MKLNLPTILSFNAGYVDTAGFLSLHGLFTAHVTGNFVMIGDAMAGGSEGIVPKLLALPIFCVTILALQSIALRSGREPGALRAMLIAKIVLLTVAAVAAVSFGGFVDPGGWPVIIVGMLLVAAMAVQNAAHRLHLSSAPPTTLMTGTTTQIMLDIGSLLYAGAPDKPQDVKARLTRLGIAVLAFALGCAGAALAYIQFGPWCFALPPILAMVGLALHQSQPKPA